MKLQSSEEIQIKQVLVNATEPRYVEFYSYSDSRVHIMNAKKFCEVFGYSMEELREKAES